MRVGCQALPRESWESPLGAVSCLQALWRLFLWRWKGRKLWPESSLHWSEDPSRLSTALPCSQLPGFCRQKMWCIQMRSKRRDHLHVGCWRHVGEAQLWCCWCTGERVSVKWLLPVGLLLAFSHFCSNGHPVLLWLICCVGSIGSICKFFQKRRSQVSSAGDLLARLCQKLLLGQRKQRQPFSFLGRRSLSLGQWGPAGLLYFCVSDIPSVLVIVFSVLPRKISIFCWLLALELSQGNLGGWWGGSCLGLSCLCLSYGLGWWWLFSTGQELCHSSMICWRAQEVFSCWRAQGVLSKVFYHVICDAIWSWCLLALQLSYCYFNLFHGDGLAHAVVWRGLLLQLC